MSIEALERSELEAALGVHEINMEEARAFVKSCETSINSEVSNITRHLQEPIYSELTKVRYRYVAGQVRRLSKKILKDASIKYQNAEVRQYLVDTCEGFAQSIEKDFNLAQEPYSPPKELLDYKVIKKAG